jgi:hypothetical protein
VASRKKRNKHAATAAFIGMLEKPLNIKDTNSNMRYSLNHSTNRGFMEKLQKNGCVIDIPFTMINARTGEPSSSNKLQGDLDKLHPGDGYRQACIELLCTNDRLCDGCRKPDVPCEKGGTMCFQCRKHSACIQTNLGEEVFRNFTRYPPIVQGELFYELLCTICEDPMKIAMHINWTEFDCKEGIPLYVLTSASAQQSIR